jgi:hypothetical protein
MEQNELVAKAPLSADRGSQFHKKIWETPSIEDASIRALTSAKSPNSTEIGSCKNGS